MKFCSLASGSSGNCLYISSNGTDVLIDAGLSAREAVSRLQQIGGAPDRIAALLITHEHSDHCHGAGVLARRFACPIYTTERTLEAIEWYLLGGKVRTHTFRIDEPFAVGSLTFHPFRVFHDAREPCGLVIEDDCIRLGIATDLGVVTASVLDALAGCHMVILEANHDLDMLIHGGYPWHLKQRIRSEVGHLSNKACGEALAKLAAGGMKVAVLAHLSQNNNRPDLALETVRRYLEGTEVELRIAPRDRLGDVVEI
ncbi:MAG: MBL fold metallo-hydrolase [Candidatus Bipolaricaulia bacterium]